MSPEEVDRFALACDIPANDVRDEIHLRRTSILASQSRIEALLEKIAMATGVDMSALTDGRADTEEKEEPPVMKVVQATAATTATQKPFGGGPAPAPPGGASASIPVATVGPTAPEAQGGTNFWTGLINAESCAFDDFATHFAKAFNKGEALSPDMRERLSTFVDAYPHDGTITQGEWKRFVKLIKKAKLTPMEFLKQSG